MTRRIPALPGVLSMMGVLALSGCPSPDVEASFQGFLDETQDERDEAKNVKMDMGGTLADVSGTFLFALDTIVQPGTPLQFIATVTFTPDGAGGMLGMDLQPLALDKSSLTEPRTPVGDVITVAPVAVSEGGQFEIPSLGVLIVTGEANPITGSEIEAEPALAGSILNEDIFCGQVTGPVTRPIQIVLDGSTFAAERVESTDPASLPQMPLLKCPEGDLPGDDGGETGDTGELPSDSGDQGG